MKKEIFKIISGPMVLCEVSDMNIALACLEGILNKFGQGDNFSITITKDTIDTEDGIESEDEEDAEEIASEENVEENK